MSDPEDQLPASVREARAVVEAQHRSVRTMLAGIFAWTAAMVAGAAFAPSGLDDTVLLVFVILFLGWSAVGALRSIRMRPEVDRSRAVLKEWDRRALVAELDGEAPEEPPDPRWERTRTLVARIRKLGAGDERVVPAAEALLERLRTLLGDVAVLREAAEAEADLDPQGERLERLRQAMEAKESLVEQITDTLRDLHVELSLRETGGTDPVLHAAQDLVRRLEAEAEVATLPRLPREPLRSSRPPVPKPERE